MMDSDEAWKLKAVPEGNQRLWQSSDFTKFTWTKK